MHCYAWGRRVGSAKKPQPQIFPEQVDGRSLMVHAVMTAILCIYLHIHPCKISARYLICQYVATHQGDDER